MNDDAPRPAGSLDRRRFLGALGASGAGVALGGSVLGACTASEGNADEPGSTFADQIVAFRGAHQAGIVTPAQDRMVFASFDVITDDADALRALLDTWSDAAEALTAGASMPGGSSEPNAPPRDTGEAYGLGAAHLTLTIGYGPSLFDERFGLGARRPGALAPLPRFPLDELQTAISGGDVCIQACADDQLVAYHAIHNLIRAGIGVVTTRWIQVGFGRTSSTSASQATARNLMGFKDGTRNVKAEDPELVDSWVWSDGSGDTSWMAGGSYLVARKIQIFAETWDHESLRGQQEIFGRVKDSGAPLGAASEFAPPDLDATDASGEPIIAADAHIRRASPQHNGGVHLLRRGYNYTDGVEPIRGNLDVGLFFIAFTSDPAHFTTVQRSLAHADALNEYVAHISSSVFACPRGLDDTGSWGRQLFG